MCEAKWQKSCGLRNVQMITNSLTVAKIYGSFPTTWLWKPVLWNKIMSMSLHVYLLPAGTHCREELSKILNQSCLFALWGLSFYSCVFIVTILYLWAVVRAKTVSLSVRTLHILLFISAYCANKWWWWWCSLTVLKPSPWDISQWVLIKTFIQCSPG